MYRILVKFGNGKHRAGVARSAAEANAFLWEISREARLSGTLIVSYDLWKEKKRKGAGYESEYS